MELEKLLQKLGLEEKEAKVYLALLKLGEAKATNISQQANLDRTLVYQLADKLMHKGLVSYKIKNNVKYFSSADPKKLMQDLKEKEIELKDALPKLKELQSKKKEKTNVEIFKGKKGLKAVLRDIIETKKDYIVFGEAGRFQKTLPIDSYQFLKQLEENKIKEKVLARKDLKDKVLKAKTSKFRYLPKDYLSPSTTLVYGNKVANFIWTEPYYVILTENKEVADSFRTHFGLLWKIAKG